MVETHGSREKIGFIGLGRMGSAMAHNLSLAGRELVVHDLRAESVVEFCRHHKAVAASDLSKLASCSLIITMLPSGKDVEWTMFEAGEGGLAHLLAPGTLVIDCSTSDPLATREAGERLAMHGIRMIDAPVAGGVVFARDGSLDILVGGAKTDISRAEPVLLAMGSRLHRCGDLGMAHAMKLLNNFVNAQVMLCYAEAISAGLKFGIDIDVIAGSMRQATTGRNHPFEKKIVAQVLSGRFSSGMALGLIRKDVGLAKSLAHGIGAWSPLMDVTEKLFRRAVDEIGDDADQTQVARLWKTIPE